MSTFVLRAAAVAAAFLPLWGTAAPLSLEAAIELAVQRSEAARAARIGAGGAREAARAAGQLPDPMLRAGIENLPVSGSDRLGTRDAMTMKRIGLSQAFVSAAKRSARQAAAEADARKEAARADVAAADTRLQAALAFLDGWFAGEAVKLASALEHHAHEALEAERARLSASTATATQVLGLAAARGVIADEAEEARQQQARALVALQRWTGQETTELLPAGAPAQPAEAAYVQHHPSVASLRREIDAARLAAAASAADHQPDWTWEVAYGQRSGHPDMVSFGISVPLPVAPAHRQHRATAARLAQAQQAEAGLAEAQRGAAAEYRALQGDARRLEERIRRYGASVLRVAEQRTAVALAAYRANQAPLATLFEARHAELEARRKLLALQRDLATTQARLAFTPLAEGAIR